MLKLVCDNCDQEITDDSYCTPHELDCPNGDDGDRFAQSVTVRGSINAIMVICGAVFPANNVFVGQKAATIDPNCVIVVG